MIWNSKFKFSFWGLRFIWLSFCLYCNLVMWCWAQWWQYLLDCFTLVLFSCYTPRNEVVVGYTGFTMSVRPSVDESCRMITWVVFLRIFWNFISSLPVKRGGSLSFLTIFTFVVPELLDLIMTENRIFTLCRMITWVVFLRMFWDFINSLPVKRRGSLSFLTIFTFAVPELLDLIWRKIWFLPYVVW